MFSLSVSLGFGLSYHVFYQKSASWFQYVSIFPQRSLVFSYYNAMTRLTAKMGSKSM